MAERVTFTAELQDEVGITFVIVTHDQEEAMTVASRVAVMDDGRIVQIATPDEIYEAPNTAYVADFIGDEIGSVSSRKISRGSSISI